MKDAYSFHTTQEDLEAYYERCFHAYERIFARAGLPEVISVASGSGMMGGSLSHEFMLLTPVGEDSIAVCGCCDYRANMEAAESIVRNVRDEVSQPLTRVYTPDIHTIEDICRFLGTPDGEERQGRRLPAQRGRLLHRAFIRGDLDVNETKLRNFIGEDVHPRRHNGGLRLKRRLHRPVRPAGRHYRAL